MKNLLILTLLIMSINAKSQTGYVFKNNIKDTLIGVVDLQGKTIIKNDYAEFRALHGYILARKYNQKSSSLYASNGFMIKDGITYFFEFGNRKHLLLKGEDGKWGLYNVKGRKITDYIYDNIIHSSELPDYGQVIKGTEYILIDTLGNEIFNNKERNDFKKQVRHFKREKGISEEDLMIEMSYEDSEEPEVFKDMKNSKFGLRFKGTILVEPIYDEIKQMCCNCLVVKKNSKYGVITTNGKILLKTDFENIENIGYGKIIANYKGKYGVYDARTGEIIIKPSFGYLKFL